MATLLETFH